MKSPKRENLATLLQTRKKVDSSDGDLQMLQWTDAGSGPSFCLYVHHDDSEREWAYDRQSSVGLIEKVK